jgi:hypothetical protein
MDSGLKGRRGEEEEVSTEERMDERGQKNSWGGE